MISRKNLACGSDFKRRRARERKHTHTHTHTHRAEYSYELTTLFDGKRMVNEIVEWAKNEEDTSM